MTTAEKKLNDLASKNPPSKWIEKAKKRKSKYKFSESGINEHYQEKK